MKIINLYCEGKRGSHDFDILEKVIEGHLNITIKPIGGKYGANAIMEYQEKSGNARSDFYLLFRDRDFDAPVPTAEQLHFDNKKAYYSYRTTIENYLLDVNTFFDFLQEQSNNNNYGLNTEEAVKALFIKVAKELKYYQAVRHTLGELRFNNSFNTTWVTGSGTLPSALDLETCSSNAWQLIENTLNKSNQKWTKETFEATLQDFLMRFDEVFFDELKFLVYYQGKDFAKALTKELPSFPIDNYYKYAKKYFDYTKYADLVELRAIIEQQLV
jgi:hypothetical protein